MRLTYLLLPLLLSTGLLRRSRKPWEMCFLAKRYGLLQAHFALAFISLFFIFSVIFIFAPRAYAHTETFKSMVDGYHRH